MKLVVFRVFACLVLTASVAVAVFAIAHHWGPWQWAYAFTSNRSGEYPPLDTGAATVAITMAGPALLLFLLSRLVTPSRKDGAGKG